MNQFKSAWQFALLHWQFLAVMAFPVCLFEIITAYYMTDLSLLMEGGNPDDIAIYFELNALPLTFLSFISIILSISFLGGVFVAFNALQEGQAIKPYDALFQGFKKFFPLLGAYIICTIVAVLGLFMLILPMFYLIGRLALFPAYMMLEGKGARESITSSWESTDQHGTILFLLTLGFTILSTASASLLLIILPGSAGDPSILQLGLTGVVEYIFVFPWMYVYFSLYKSLKSE